MHTSLAHFDCIIRLIELGVVSGIMIPNLKVWLRELAVFSNYYSRILRGFISSPFAFDLLSNIYRVFIPTAK